MTGSGKIDILSYPVFVGENVLEDLSGWIGSRYPASRIFVLTDENVARLHEERLRSELTELNRVSIRVLPAGESIKDLDYAKDCWTWLTENNATKTDLLVNFGGGAVTDLGGFVAGTYKRGIPYLNVPTSLIGQTDAALGGKTGINFMNLKNQVGLFRDPEAVFIDPRFLLTLPAREVNSGYIEIIKSALLTGGEFWETVRSVHMYIEHDFEKFLKWTVQAKMDFVIQDPFDLNVRKALNFGHTIGHAIEGLSHEKGANPLTHGEAVALGIICESYISNKITGLTETDLQSVKDTINKFIAVDTLDIGDSGKFMDYIRQDKKNSGGRYLFSLVEAPGKPVTGVEVSEDLIRQAISENLKFDAG